MGNSVSLITTGGSISLTTTGSLVSLTTIGGSMLRASVGELPWIPEPSTVNNKLKRRFNLLFTVEGSGIQGIGESIFCSNQQQISKLNTFYKHDTTTSFRRSLTDKYTTTGSK